ncbi:Vgb family protein [Sorangium sp. So ce363]|uniref:Vgb family protein n=1 Tax=Sorangium sp. So ce363 TaxID=3133304 RepID=UPI003F627185
MTFSRSAFVVSMFVAVLAVGFSVAPPEGAAAEDDDVLRYGTTNDYLYVSDSFGDTVVRFDAETGALLGTVESGPALRRPNGVITIGRGSLLVANQNAALPVNGEILRYVGPTGRFTRAIVPRDDPDAPLTPRGIVVRSGILYVANQGQPATGEEGSISLYRVGSGAFLGDLSTAGYTDDFYPTGIVFGPDGDLYVTVRNAGGGTAPGGRVLRFDPESGFVEVFVPEGDFPCDLNRPEGLVFGPDNRLYVVSFRASPSDLDRILIFNGDTGECVDQIPLNEPGAPREFAQALVFGPDDFLYVTVITSTLPFAGEVRRYDVTTKEYTVFIPEGIIEAPNYLVFGRSDPATLAYGRH